MLNDLDFLGIIFRIQRSMNVHEVIKEDFRSQKLTSYTFLTMATIGIGPNLGNINC